MMATDSLAAVPESCLNDDEAQLLSLIDQYRHDKGLQKVPWSKSLTQVAQWHVIDAVQNGHNIFTSTCNMHSWSNMHNDIWTPVCYTSDHAGASKMWSKPSEITNGIYQSYGYEIAARGYTSVSAALTGWKESSGHNNVILNQGTWAAPQLSPWKAMGVGVNINSRYYFVWFSTATDPQGEVQPCSGSLIFSDGLE